jgi:hypothetical protein
MGDRDRLDVLYQDARWLRIARFQYGIIAGPLWLLGLIGSISTGVPSHVALSLALFTPPIAICEWRLRKMGMIIRNNELVLVRPLNRTRIPWQQIESFTLIIPSGFIDYGARRIGVKRRHGLIPRSTMRIPTLWVSIKGEKRWPPLNGPSRLKWADGEAPDPLAFLNNQLAEHHPAPEDGSGTPAPLAHRPRKLANSDIGLT